MTNKEFNVFGDKELQKSCKVNIFISDETGNIKKESLLVNGQLNKVFVTNSAAIYTVYFSYKDSLYASIDYENIFKGSDEEINHFYLEQKKELIGVKFIGRKSDLKDFTGTVTLFTTLSDYFEKHNIKDDSEKKVIKENFMNTYN
jgi:hypothetical protein